MTEKVLNAQEIEDKKIEDAAKVAADKATEDANIAAGLNPDGSKKDATVGDLLKDGKKETKMVPEAALLEYKNEAKEFKKELADLKAKIENGEFSKKEITADVKALADELGVSEETVNKLLSKINPKDAIDKAISERMAPIEAKEKAERIEKIFSENFDKTLEDMPEFKKLVNRDVIKALSLDPKNANKTFAQIIEDSYGHLVTGKRTLEKTQNRGGVSEATVDFDKARKDQSYLKEILSNPETKKKYNEGLLDRLKL